MKRYTPGHILVYLCLLALCAAGGTFATRAEAGTVITDCTYCHGVPPKDGPRSAATVLSPSNATFVGNHQTHASSDIRSCERCHPGSSSYTYAHMTTVIKLAANIGNSGGQYRKNGVPVTFLNQTSVPQPGSCFTVNCHFNTATDTWGTPAYAGASIATCAKCHSAAPATGSHARHFQLYSSGSPLAACAKCHPNHLASGKPFQHATSAAPGHRPLAVQFGGAPGGAGSYAAGSRVNYPNYLTSTTGYGSCSATYCHKGSTPTWGASGPLACSSCHDATNTGLSGRHDRHYNSATAPASLTAGDAHTSSAYVFGCQNCHPTNQHAQGPFDSTGPVLQDAAVSGTRITSYSQGAVSTIDGKGLNHTQGGTCTTACHTRDGVNPPNQPAIWTSSATTFCDVCHSKAGDSSTTWTSSHTTHINLYGANPNFTCNTCHRDTAANNTTIGSTGRNQHPNGVKNVQFNSFANSTATWSGTQCQNMYCHGNGQSLTPTTAAVTWSVPLPPLSGGGICANCHYFAAGSLSLSHPKHPLACNTCHSATVAGIGALKYDRHVNKQVDVQFSNQVTPAIGNAASRYNGFLAYSAGNVAQNAVGSTKGFCANIYCHSDGKRNAALRSYTSVRWGGASLGCNSCHGRKNAVGAPDYASGVGRENSHGKHATLSADCVKCHSRTTLNGTAIVGGTSTHLDGDPKVNLSNVARPFSSYSGKYNSVTRTCTATYCHGGSTVTPAWGETSAALVPLKCDSCHSAANAGNWTAISAHRLHWATNALPTDFSAPAGNNGTATQYQFSCASCHKPGSAPATSAQHASGPVSANQNAQVFFGFTSGTLKGTYTPAGSAQGTADNGFTWTAGSCANTYCHSDGAGHSPAAPTWGAAASSGNCGICHGKAGDAAWTGSSPHLKHVTTYQANNNITCGSCHSQTASGSGTLIDKTLHVNKRINVSFDTFAAGGGTAPPYNQSARQCQNLYCHGNGTTMTPTVTVTWSGTTNCGSCHADQGSSSATGNHQKHSQVAACSVCHGAGYSSSTVAFSTHVNQSVNVSFTGAAAGTSFSKGTAFAPGQGFGSCSNISCHGAALPSASWGTTLNCSGCHPTLSGAHAVHVGDLLSSNSVKAYGNYTASRSTGSETGAWNAATNSYKFGCANCHPIAAVSHMNGSVDVTLTRDTTGASGNIRKLNPATGPAYNGSKQCLNIYCHSNGYATNTVYATTPAWTSTFAAAGGDRCAKCHDNAPGRTNGIAGSGAHDAHSVGIHYLNIFSGGIGKLPQGGGASVNGAHGRSNRSTTISCNVCHFGTMNLAANDRNPRCSNAANGCHGNGAAPQGDARITNRAMHVNAAVNVSFLDDYLRTKAQLRDGSFAYYTSASAGGWQRSRGYKNYTSSRDIMTKAKLSTVNYTGGSCVVACHNNNGVSWTATGLTCQSCHSRL